MEKATACFSKGIFFCYVRWYFSLFYNIKIHRGYLFGIFTIGSECGWCNILRCDFPLHHHRPAGSDPFFSFCNHPLWHYRNPTTHIQDVAINHRRTLPPDFRLHCTVGFKKKKFFFLHWNFCRADWLMLSSTIKFSLEFKKKRNKKGQLQRKTRAYRLTFGYRLLPGWQLPEALEQHATKKRNTHTIL